MRLIEILTSDCVKVPLDAGDKAQAIAELMDLVCLSDAVTDRDAVLGAVLAREATRTTGIGGGLAIPHGKSPALKRIVMAIGRPAQPIEFDSIDGKPVDLIVLLASPIDQAGPHIQALARISRLMTVESLRIALASADSAEQFFEILVRQDEGLGRAL